VGEPILIMILSTVRLHVAGNLSSLPKSTCHHSEFQVHWRLFFVGDDVFKQDRPFFVGDDIFTLDNLPVSEMPVFGCWLVS
jgi:hypothetical protein